MRAFLLALALVAAPFTLTACADDTAVEQGAPAGDQADVIGDGEVIDEAGEPDADVLGDGMMNDTTMVMGDTTVVVQ